eukprot:7379404-Prymnesium_polylepis.1
MRVKEYGAMPFTMKTNEYSWNVFGTNVDTLDRRIKDVFKVAGLRRQSGDPVTYLGRHTGTRLLQHAGGSAEGGAARRGHSNGTASFHYTETPLPDLLRLAGNDSATPFIPAHHQASLHPLADAVLTILFPELDAHDKVLDARQREVDAMRGNADKVRTEEQLNDQQRLARSIRFTMRVALCCLVARPRSWEQWKILENEGTVWQRAKEANHRVVFALFRGNKDAIHAMEALALAVLRAEEAEIAGRAATPGEAITTQVVSAITEIREQAAARERMLLEQQQAMHQATVRYLMSMGQSNGDAPPPPEPLPPPPAEAPPAAPPPPSAATVAATAGARIKRKRESQEDVTHFSTWPNMGDALQYAKRELVPREKEEGAKWRLIPREDGTRDQSRHDMWFKYYNLAIAVGMLMRDGKSYDEAVVAVQVRFESFGMKAHTPFLRAIKEESKKRRDKDLIAAEILGL